MSIDELGNLWSDLRATKNPTVFSGASAHHMPGFKNLEQETDQYFIYNDL